MPTSPPGSPKVASRTAALPSVIRVGSEELPSARLRDRPEDFVVEEIPAYVPEGRGNHLFVTFRKTGMNTQHAVRQLAEALGVDRRDAGIAGNKDRHAVTTQTVSFLMEGHHEGTPEPREGTADAAAGDALEGAAPGGVVLDEAAMKRLGDAAIEGIEVLNCSRHPHKLKTGHLRGNRFTITLRDIAAEARAGIDARLAQIREQGVPNAFGPQRFGRYGDNAERAREWILGGKKAPRDRRLRRLLFSALQSQLFNEVLARRVADGSWATVLAGDLAQKHDSGGVFWVEPEQLDADRRRAAEGLISATGPMFGAKMRWPRAQPGEWERGVLDASGLSEEKLKQHAKLGKGARRALRLWVKELSFHWDATESYLTTSFVLPKGAYATTVLSQVCTLFDASQSSTPTTPHRDLSPQAAAPSGEAASGNSNAKLVDAPSADVQQALSDSSPAASPGPAASSGSSG